MRAFRTPSGRIRRPIGAKAVEIPSRPLLAPLNAQLLEFPHGLYEVGSVKLEWNGGDSFRPAWRIEATERSIGNLEIEPNFARVMDIVPQSEIIFTFGIWASDIEDDANEKNAMATDQVDVGDDSLLYGADDKLPLVKRRILMKLAASALESKEEFIVLAKNKATFLAE
jgi:hypothetical protein